MMSSTNQRGSLQWLIDPDFLRGIEVDCFSEEKKRDSDKQSDKREMKHALLYRRFATQTAARGKFRHFSPFFH